MSFTPLTLAYYMNIFKNFTVKLIKYSLYVEFYMLLLYNKKQRREQNGKEKLFGYHSGN